MFKTHVYITDNSSLKTRHEKHKATELPMMFTTL